jgi:hypothetical protein
VAFNDIDGMLHVFLPATAHKLSAELRIIAAFTQSSSLCKLPLPGPSRMTHSANSLPLLLAASVEINRHSSN